MRTYQYNSYLTVEIETVGDSKHVTIVSSIHVNKRHKLSVTFSTDFSDGEIMKSSEFINAVWRYTV